MIFKITVSAIRLHIGGARCSTWRAYVLEPTREKCAHEVAIDAAHWEGLKNPKVVAIGPAQIFDRGFPPIIQPSIGSTKSTRIPIAVLIRRAKLSTSVATAAADGSIGSPIALCQRRLSEPGRSTGR